MWGVLTHDRDLAPKNTPMNAPHFSIPGPQEYLHEWNPLFGPWPTRIPSFFGIIMVRDIHLFKPTSWVDLGHCFLGGVNAN